jgi:hypothetical protein
MTMKKFIIASCALVTPLLMAAQCHSPEPAESSDKGSVEPAAKDQAQQSGDGADVSGGVGKETQTAEPQAGAAKNDQQAETGKTAGDKPDQIGAQSASGEVEPKTDQPQHPVQPTLTKTETTGPAKSRTVMTGCLDNPDARKGQGRRATPGPGPGQSEGVIVEAQGDGAIEVRHNLTHNCCYKAEVDTKVKGAEVRVTETLSGTVCRCNCSSTIRTTVPLKKGDYSVTVDLVQNGKTSTVYEGKISL